MDKLRRHRRVLRAAATRTLTSTDQVVQDTDPTASVLQAVIDALEEKDAILNALNTKISHLLKGEEFEEELEAALNFHDQIRHATTKLRFSHNNKYGFSTENTSVPTALFTYA